MSDPLTVEVTRGVEVESQHEVHIAMVDGRGLLTDHLGDSRRPTLSRSALKPIQAIPLMTTGAAPAYGLTDDELALACASHNGEHEHVHLVDGWLARLGLGAHALECGAHPPGAKDAADDLVRQGRQPDARHNNCSGKHAAMLTIAAHLSLEPTGYIEPDHPIQARHVTPAIEELCRCSVSEQTPAVDGCGMPVWTLTLEALARGWSQLATRGSGRSLLEAMVGRPHLVAGSGHECTRLMLATEGRAAVKNGAEGVYCGVELTSGRAFALKAVDGASRAAETAAAWILDRWGLLDDAPPRELTNWSGAVTGEMRVAHN